MYIYLYCFKFIVRTTIVFINGSQINVNNNNNNNNNSNNISNNKDDNNNNDNNNNNNNNNNNSSNSNNIIILKHPTNGNTRKRWEICLKLTIKTPERIY